jgi:hypothetical protein
MQETRTSHQNGCPGNVFQVDKSEWICRGNSAEARTTVTPHDLSRFGADRYRAVLGSNLGLPSFGLPRIGLLGTIDSENRTNAVSRWV